MEILRKKQIGLFLLDWNMPQLNGISFVKKLRSMPEYAKTPVIMITSEAAKFSVLTAIQAGVTDYVVKPVNDAVLWGKILPHLRNH